MAIVGCRVAVLLFHLQHLLLSWIALQKEENKLHFRHFLFLLFQVLIGHSLATTKVRKSHHILNKISHCWKSLTRRKLVFLRVSDRYMIVWNKGSFWKAILTSFNHMVNLILSLIISLQYFLKARFHFKKDNFADVMLIANICSATSQVTFSLWIGVTNYNFFLVVIFHILTFQIMQLLLMPMLAPLIGEEVLLCLGLIAGFTNVCERLICTFPGFLSSSHLHTEYTKHVHIW